MAAHPDTPITMLGWGVPSLIKNQLCVVARRRASSSCSCFRIGIAASFKNFTGCLAATMMLPAALAIMVLLLPETQLQPVSFTVWYASKLVSAECEAPRWVTCYSCHGPFMAGLKSTTAADMLHAPAQDHSIKLLYSCLKSAGHSESNSIRCLVTGWVNPRVLACSAGRPKPSTAAFAAAAKLPRLPTT